MYLCVHLLYEQRHIVASDFRGWTSNSHFYDSGPGLCVFSMTHTHMQLICQIATSQSPKLVF